MGIKNFFYGEAKVKRRDWRHIHHEGHEVCGDARRKKKELIASH
jgi:hypothetical protein